MRPPELLPLRVLALVAGLCLSTGALAQDITFSKSMLTDSWYNLSNDPSPEGFLIFRRYALILNQAATGETTFQDIRNIMSANCAIDEQHTSYIQFFIPRELSIEDIFGGKYFESYTFPLVTEKGNEYQVNVEVQKNSLFADFTVANEGAIGLLMSKSFILALSDKQGIGFSVFDQKLPWLEGRQLTFDEIVEEQLPLNGAKVTKVSTADVKYLCD